MHHHVLWSAVALYRGGTLTLGQAARHAGVSSTRMERALRHHGVTPTEAVAAPSADATADSLGPAGAD